MTINAATVLGFFVFLFSLPLAVLAVVQVFLNLQRRADTSPAVILKSILILFQGFGRFFLLPIAGWFLMTLGWRLDPILQFAFFLLVIGILLESTSSIVSDYYKWRYRTGRATAVIAGKAQPSDTFPLS